MNSPVGKYRPFPTIHLPDRQWPNRTVEKAPQWCSVDLRDGNQALAQPMNVSQKLEMFVEFVRRLIEDGCIPDDVTIQVLVQAREDLIEPTMRALVGAKRVIIHLYNSTSPAQRRVVFGLEKPAIVKIATR